MVYERGPQTAVSRPTRVQRQGADTNSDSKTAYGLSLRLSRGIGSEVGVKVVRARSDYAGKPMRLRRHARQGPTVLFRVGVRRLRPNPSAPHVPASRSSRSASPPPGRSEMRIPAGTRSQRARRTADRSRTLAIRND